MYTPVFGKVEIEVEDQLSNLDIQIKSNFTFLVGWGEWVVGDFERKAISASNSVEVEVEDELGNIVATTSLPAVDHPNAARSCQN